MSSSVGQRRDGSRFVGLGLCILLLATALVDSAYSSQSMGYVQFKIIDFSQTDATWSLIATVGGNQTSASMMIQITNSKVNSIIPANYVSYDRVQNTTTFVLTTRSDFTNISGAFPFEHWTLSLWFSLNAQLSNLPVGDFSVQMPTNNYYGLLFVGAVYPNSSFGIGADSSLHKYGQVYYLSIGVQRSIGVAQQLDIWLNQFPFALYVILAILSGVALLELCFSIIRIKGKPKEWKTGKAGVGLLDGTYFTILVSILVFLPIYLLTVRSLETPIPITTGDLSFVHLIGYYLALLTVSLVFSLFSRYTFNNRIQFGDTKNTPWTKYSQPYLIAIGVAIVIGVAMFLKRSPSRTRNRN